MREHPGMWTVWLYGTLATAGALSTALLATQGAWVLAAGAFSVTLLWAAIAAAILLQKLGKKKVPV